MDNDEQPALSGEAEAAIKLVGVVAGIIVVLAATAALTMGALWALIRLWGVLFGG